MPALTITNAGRQAAIDAANQGMTVRIETIAVGSGRYTPDGTETALQTQLASTAIANARQLDDQLALYSLFTSGQWTAYELGLFLDDGSLFAVASDGAAGDVLYTKDAANLAITVNLMLTTVPIGSVTVAANLLFQLGNEFVRRAGDTMTGDLLTVTPPQDDDSKKAVNSEWVRGFFGAASHHEYTVAGTYSLTWASAAASAVMIIEGAGGGGGGGNNGSGGVGGAGGHSGGVAGSPGTGAGGRGGQGGHDSTVTRGSTSYTAHGGAGGAGGSAPGAVTRPVSGASHEGIFGGGNLRLFQVTSIATGQTVAYTYGEDGRPAGGAGGLPSVQGPFSVAGAKGGNGERNAFVITGLSPGDTLDIVVGAGGNGGGTGGDGTDGTVRIYLLF